MNNTFQVLKNKIDSLKDPSFYCILFIFGLAIIIKTVISFEFNSPIIFGDEVVYFTKAQTIFNSGNLFASPPLSDTFPGYPLIISICFFFTQSQISSYHLILILNGILTTSIIFPTYFILTKYCTKLTSIFGSIVLITLPCVIGYNNLVMSENLFIPLIIFSCWFFIEYWQNKSRFFEILFIFTVILLIITRPTGFIMGLSFLVIYLFKKYAQLSKTKKGFFIFVFFVLFLTLGTLIKYFVIDSQLNIGPYNVTYFLNVIVYSLKTTDSLVHILLLFVYKIEYLILCSYWVFFFFTGLLILYITMPNTLKKIFKLNLFQDLNSAQMKGLTGLVFYVLLTSLFLIGISVFFNYRSETIFTNTAPGFFEVYGRYIDPIVPLIFILGIISISLFVKQIKQVSQKFLFCFIGLTIGIIYVFNQTFPFIIKEQFATGNNLAIWYLIILKSIIPVWITIGVLFCILTIILSISLLLSTRKSYWLLIVILISLIIGFTVVPFEKSLSDYTNSQNEIGKYLSENYNKSTLLIIDSNFDGDLTYYWLSMFLSNGPIRCYPILNESSLPNNNTNYLVITTQQLSIPRIIFPIGTSTGGLSVYKSNFSANNIISNSDPHKYIWLEAEDFSGITTHQQGWGKASFGYDPVSNNLVLSGSNSISNNTIFHTLKITNTDTDQIYNIWVRARVFTYSPSSFILKIDDSQFYYYQNKSNTNHWVWKNLGTLTLVEKQHTISLIKSSLHPEKNETTWAAVDEILITSNLTYIPMDGMMPPT